MTRSPSERYLLTVRFGKRRIHGLHIYNWNEAVAAKERLIALGARPGDIRIDPYDAVFSEGVFESEVIKRVV